MLCVRVLWGRGGGFGGGGYRISRAEGLAYIRVDRYLWGCRDSKGD